MGMTIDNLKQECIYCYREVDTSGLEGFRCTNKTVNKTTSWCRPKNANEPCSICEYCKPKKDEMSIDECIEIWTHPTQYFPSKREEAVDFVIDIMRKYQKIEQIAREGKNETRCEEIVRIIDGKA